MEPEKFDKTDVGVATVRLADSEKESYCFQPILCVLLTPTCLKKPQLQKWVSNKLCSIPVLHPLEISGISYSNNTPKRLQTTVRH